MNNRLPAAPRARAHVPAAQPQTRSRNWPAGAGLGRLLDTSPRLLLQRQQLDALGIGASQTRCAEGAPLQRKLTLRGDATLRLANLEDLNRMLEGTAARVDANDDGTVHFTARPGEGDPTDHEGYRLLLGLIEHAKDVEIGHDDKLKDPGAKPTDIDAAADAMRGSNSFLNLPPNFTSSDLVQDNQGEIQEAVTPRFMVMAHELIHAQHYADGKRAKGFGDYPVEGSFENRKLGKATYGSRKEEINTVGLGPQSPGAITENALRSRLKMPTRPLYESDNKAAAKWLRTKQQPAQDKTGEGRSKLTSSQ